MFDPQNPDYSNTPASAGRPAFFYYPKDPSTAPVVSIITTFYNTGEIFHETARSVQRQSFQQWEWLIVNDGSTDSIALDILEYYRNRDPRIRVIDHSENRGVCAARNTGLAEARSNSICLLDSDDLIEPTAIEKWVCFLETHPEWSFVGGYSIGFGEQEYLWRKGFLSNEENLDENQIHIASLLRREVFKSVGGFDEQNRSGLTDWEFWIRCAANGYWGTSIREFLGWYRRRSTHTDRWENWQPEKMKEFHADLMARFPALWEGGFPKIQAARRARYQPLVWEIPFENRLEKASPRLLLIVPWLNLGGANKFNLDLIQQLRAHGWEVTIITTIPSDHAWAYEFSRLTPDIFMLNNFLPVADWPRFIKYLISSRSFDAVLVSHSLFGYQMLPFIRAEFPELAILDYSHVVSPGWFSGGYPRISTIYHHNLDLHIVSSHALRDWMIEAGIAPERIELCTTNIDAELWRPDPEIRRVYREKLEIDRATPLIVFNARIVQDKQPHVFIQTIRKLHHIGLSFKVLVIGDGPLLDRLKQDVMEYELEAVVTFLGALPNQEVQNWIKAGDILFLPSALEGIAIAVYEAMATELVPVSAQVGGQEELVTPECGFLIPRAGEDEEVDEYSHVLEALLRDPEQRRRMAAAGRERILKYFRIEQMGERMASILDQAREMPRNPPDSSYPKEPARLATQEIIDAMQAQAESEQYIQELIEARKWSDGEIQNWIHTAKQREERIRELEQYIADLLQGKAWLEEQRQNWMHTAEQQETRLHELDQYIADLLQGKAWLEKQRQNWMHTAEQLEASLHELEQYNAELLKGKEWLDEQRLNWMQAAEEKQKIIDESQPSLLDKSSADQPTPTTDQDSSSTPILLEEPKNNSADEPQDRRIE